VGYQLKYSDYVTSEGPPNPEEWVGPPGPPGPPGPQGPPGEDATGEGSGTVTQIDTVGPGIEGGPIVNAGVLTVQWNAGTTNYLGAGLDLTDGILSSTASGGGSDYTLPVASTTTLGGVKVDGGSIVIDGTGVISSTTGGSGTVLKIDTVGPGITGGPITTVGSLSVQWNAGTVSTIGTGLLLSAGNLLNSGVVTFNTRSGPVTLSSKDVTDALTYTPYNATNPAGYQNAAQVTAALVPYAPINNATFTGTTTLAGSPSLDLHASTKLYVDQGVAAIAATGITVIPYNSSTTTTAANPGNGSVRWNTTQMYDATALYISNKASDSTDWAHFFRAQVDGVKIVIQLKGDSSKICRFLTTGPIVDNTGWMTIPVTMTGAGGYQGMPFAGGQNVVVCFLPPGSEQYLPIEGGTLQGPLYLPSTTPSGATQATHKQYVDDNRAPYTLAAYVGGVLTASQVLLLHQVGSAIVFPANFGATVSGGSSRCGSLVNATASTVLTVGQCVAASDPTNTANYTAIGTLTFSASGHVGALATTGGTSKSIAAGDFIRVIGPVSPDAGLAGVFLTLVGNR
jgi:hypothetical protein